MAVCSQRRPFTSLLRDAVVVVVVVVVVVGFVVVADCLLSLLTVEAALSHLLFFPLPAIIDTWTSTG